MAVPRPESDILAVIRSSGERTQDACRRLLELQVPAAHVVVVEDRPFEATLRRTCAIGAGSGARWMMTLDADVLLRDGSVDLLLAQAERMPGHGFQIEGVVFDKLSGTLRRAGQRIYRAALLERALELIPADGTEMRPEMTTIERMRARGFPSHTAPVVMGVHDFEQYYRDLYRKAFMHAHKHLVWLTPFIERWRAGAPSDPDFAVALRGLSDGLASWSRPTVDTRAYAAGAAAALAQLGLPEKDVMPASDRGFPQVEALLAGAPAATPERDGESLGAKWGRAAQRCREMGPARYAAFVAGSLLLELGAGLRGMATREPT